MRDQALSDQAFNETVRWEKNKKDNTDCGIMLGNKKDNNVYNNIINCFLWK